MVTSHRVYEGLQMYTAIMVSQDLGWRDCLNNTVISPLGEIMEINILCNNNRESITATLVALVALARPLCGRDKSWVMGADT